MQEGQGQVYSQSNHLRYGDGVKYWDQRYNQDPDATFEWLEEWDTIKPTIEKHAIRGLYDKETLLDKDRAFIIKNSLNILIPGCGNSKTSE
jgi:hypothetical protein